MWPNPQIPVDLIAFTEEILNGKLHFLCSDAYYLTQSKLTSKNKMKLATYRHSRTI